MILEFIQPAMTEMVSKKESEVREALNIFWHDWNWKFVDAKKRCWINVDPRNRIETLYADGIPVLEMRALEFSEPELVGDRYVQRITQNFRRLSVCEADAKKR